MQRLFTILSLLCALAAVAFAPSALAEERLVVTLHEKIFTSARIVRLSEVAYLASPDAVLVAKAGATTLGRGPRGEAVVKITADRVSERLRWCGISAEDFIITGLEVSVFNSEFTKGESVLATLAKPAAAAEVATKPAEAKEVVEQRPVTSLKEADQSVLPKKVATGIIEPQTLIDAALEDIALLAHQKTQISLDEIVVEVKEKNPALRRLGSGDIEYLNLEAIKISAAPFGTHSYRLKIRSGNETSEEYHLTVLIRYRVKVAVAKATLMAREAISEDSIEFVEKLFETTALGDAVTSYAQVLNMAPISTVPAGQELNLTKMSKALVVKQGDRVEVRPSGPAGMLFGGTWGIAKKSGGVGDDIFVEFEVDEFVGEGPNRRKKKVRTVTLVKITGAGTAEKVQKDAK